MKSESLTDQGSSKKVKNRKRKDEPSNHSKNNEEVKRLKSEKEYSEKTSKPVLRASTKETEPKDENLTDKNGNVDKNRKAEKRKERKQKKKEKRALLIEQNHVHEGKGQGKAIRYLDAWQSHHDGKESSWKFEKCRQIWLLQNAYDETKIPDSKFDSLLQYIATIKGKMKEITIETAKKKIERSEQIKDEFLTNAETKIEPLENEKTENLPEKVSKKSKKKSKKNKTEMPRDDILTEKALQRATEILEMLTD